MAATVEARRLTESYRLAQARLGADTVRQLLATWGLLDPDRLDETSERWLAVAVPLLQAQHTRSATLSATYIDLFKKLELGASASAPVVLAPFDQQAATTSLLVTGPVHIKQARSRGLALPRVLDLARTSSAGAGMRHALNGGRSTLLDTIAADRQALGYARATSGRACSFCAMLASRGPAYKNEGTADFQAHDHCSCSVEPVYRRDAAWPAGSERFAELWRQAKDADGDTTTNFRRLLEAA